MVFGVIMGTGCGGGICINGKIWSGANGIAGEWGHFSVDPHPEKQVRGFFRCDRGCLAERIMNLAYYSLTRF